MSATPVVVQTPKIGLVQIVNSDASNSKTLIDDQNSAVKVVAINFTSDEASTTRLIQIRVTRSAVDYLIGTIGVNAGAGTDGSVATADGFSLSMIPGLPVDEDGQHYIYLQDNDTLTIKSTTTVTSGKTINASAVFGNFT